MNINPTIRAAASANKGLITTGQFLGTGFSKSLIYLYLRAGLLEKVGHGVYCLPGAARDHAALVAGRSRFAVFSHETALFLLGRSRRAPDRLSITIPSDRAVPASMRKDCACYYIRPELHELGAVEVHTRHGNAVRCYNIERTICDLIRSRSRVDDSLLVPSLKAYAASESHRHLSLLAEYAVQLGVIKPLRAYMQFLI